jgi:UDP-N-acetylglucosamine acyltransferase
VGNTIGANVKIYENVTIGDNNKIFDDCIIYPHTTIGNNNLILRDNVIGEMPIQSEDGFIEKLTELGGVSIGDNNLFHVNNIIFSGTAGSTKIGNHNKLLGELHMGHDSAIGDHVCLYPRIILGGFSQVLDHAGIGFGSNLHQQRVVGSYAFIAGGNTATRDVFPFFVTINNIPKRLNTKKLDGDAPKYQDILMEICEKERSGKLLLEAYRDRLPDKFYRPIALFLSAKQFDPAK